MQLNVGVEFNLEHLMKQKRLFMNFARKITICYTIHVDSKLTIRNANKKTNEQITTLADDDMCHCR